MQGLPQPWPTEGLLPAILPADRVSKERVTDETDVHTNQRGPIWCHHLTTNDTCVPMGREENIIYFSCSEPWLAGTPLTPRRSEDRRQVIQTVLVPRVSWYSLKMNNNLLFFILPQFKAPKCPLMNYYWEMFSDISLRGHFLRILYYAVRRLSWSERARQCNDVWVNLESRDLGSNPSCATF